MNFFGKQHFVMPFCCTFLVGPNFCPNCSVGQQKIIDKTRTHLGIISLKKESIPLP